MAVHTSARLDDAPPLWPAYEGPRCRWLLAQSDLPDDGWRRPSPVPGVPSFYEHPTEEEKVLAAGFEAALDSGQAAWKPVAVELGGTRDGAWAPAGLGEYEPAPGYMFLMTWAVGPFPDREAAQRAAVLLAAGEDPASDRLSVVMGRWRRSQTFDLCETPPGGVVATGWSSIGCRTGVGPFARACVVDCEVVNLDMYELSLGGEDWPAKLAGPVGSWVAFASLWFDEDAVARSTVRGSHRLWPAEDQRFIGGQMKLAIGPRPPQSSWGRASEAMQAVTALIYGTDAAIDLECRPLSRPLTSTAECATGPGRDSRRPSNPPVASGA